MNAARKRLQAAIGALEAAGAALLVMRSSAPPAGREAAGGQLKTAADGAAEGWVLGYLKALFPRDCFLAEESYDKGSWKAPRSFWTIDALDGTRSFMDGFPGFCVQAAFVDNGRVILGVVHEPASRTTYFALRGEGAYRASRGGKVRLRLDSSTRWPRRPIFIDSRKPRGPVADFSKSVAGRFYECGSFGVKICRVAEGRAHVFAKPYPFKLWDVAPGEIILTEAGGRLGLWSGRPISYDGRAVTQDMLLAAPAGVFSKAVAALAPKEDRP